MAKKYCYFMTQRPPQPGAMPIYGLIEVDEFDTKKFVPEILHDAWAKLTYSRELKPGEVSDYELMPEFYSVNLTMNERHILMDLLERTPSVLNKIEGTKIYMKLMEVD